MPISMVYLTHNNTTKGNVMINLGTANGWKEQPEAYTKHLAECGTEHEVTICFMEYPEEGGAIKRQRQEVRRQYDVTVTRKGNCYNNYTCNECGISYDVDSSG